MQNKRDKRSRNRAARKTAGHGSKKKNRGSSQRGGFGNAGGGKRSSGKLMKVTGGDRTWLGKHGFKTLNKRVNFISLQDVQGKLVSFMAEGIATKEKDTYQIDLTKAGYDKLLSKGEVKAKMLITVGIATSNAVSKVEAAGGKVILPEGASES